MINPPDNHAIAGRGKRVLLPLLLAITTCLFIAVTIYSPPTNSALADGGSESGQKIFFQSLNGEGFYRETLKYAVKKNASVKPLPPGKIWGVIVPHHLLAADIIAETLTRISGLKPDQIVILSPDHYSRGKTFFSTAGRDLKTTVGTSSPNRQLVKALAQLPSFSVNNRIFSAEHGIGSILPFVQVLWPGIKVTPILFRSDAAAGDLKELQKMLAESIASSNILIIESTDF